MIHVYLRLVVWAIVLALAYFMFGSKLFDSSDDAGRVGGDSQIFLPPAKPQELVRYEALSEQRALSGDEAADYRALRKAWEASFWQQQGVSVQEALAGVETNRKARLAEILQQRGIGEDQTEVFLFVVERDHPELLADRE
jgi:hypothetical protein